MHARFGEEALTNAEALRCFGGIQEGVGSGRFCRLAKPLPEVANGSLDRLRRSGAMPAFLVRRLSLMRKLCAGSAGLRRVSGGASAGSPSPRRQSRMACSIRFPHSVREGDCTSLGSNLSSSHTNLVNAVWCCSVATSARARMRASGPTPASRRFRWARSMYRSLCSCPFRRLSALPATWRRVLRAKAGCSATGVLQAAITVTVIA